MKNKLYILILVAFFSCKEEKQVEIDLNTIENINQVNEVKEVLNDKEFAIKTKKIDFSLPPIDIKTLKLDDENYWVTSSMLNKKHVDSFCDYKNYKLYRGYTLIRKPKDSSKTLLEVYVKDDEFKWSRNEANEEFLSLKTSDSNFKLWKTIKVGMLKKELLQLFDTDMLKINNNKLIEVEILDFVLKLSVKDSILNNIIINRKCNQSSNITNLSKDYTVAEYQQNLFQLSLSSKYEIIYKNDIPKYLKSDFNGDGKADLAFLIKLKDISKSENEYDLRMIIFHSQNDYHIIGEGTELEENNFSIGWLHSWDIFKERKTFKTVFDKETSDIIGDKEVTLKRDAIALFHDESQTGLIYWDGNKYIYIHQGD